MYRYVYVCTCAYIYIYIYMQQGPDTRLWRRAGGILGYVLGASAAEGTVVVYQHTSTQPSCTDYNCDPTMYTLRCTGLDYGIVHYILV